LKKDCFHYRLLRRCGDVNHDCPRAIAARAEIEQQRHKEPDNTSGEVLHSTLLQTWQAILYKAQEPISSSKTKATFLSAHRQGYLTQQIKASKNEYLCIN
jgi:hypothetical protein